MSNGADFEAYLISKKIDSRAFKDAEPEVWQAWQAEFEQVHPNSFTVQKLNLINPIRRKYLLKVLPDTKVPATTPAQGATAKPGQPVVSKPGKPVMRRKPD